MQYKESCLVFTDSTELKSEIVFIE